MANPTKKFEALTQDEKDAFKDGLKTFMGYQDELDETRKAMKGQIEITADKIEGLTKKDVKKLFNYYRKNIQPSDLRDDAEILEEVKTMMGA